MSEHDHRAVIKRGDEVDYEEFDVADGVRKAVILSETDGAPNFRMRRYELDPGADVPKHTNEVEHEMHIVNGEFTVGIDDAERTVSVGDSVLIPPGEVHWFRNDGPDQSAFICMVPTGEDTIELIDSDE